MRRAVLFDSSAILALLDADDVDHAAARRTLERLLAESRPSFVTNYIQAEAHALLLSTLGRALAREWLLTASLPVLRVQPQEEERARQLIATHRDKDWSFCDATSFALMEAREVRLAFSFDRHFRQYGRTTVLGPR